MLASTLCMIVIFCGNNVIAIDMEQWLLFRFFWSYLVPIHLTSDDRGALMPEFTAIASLCLAPKRCF